MTIEDKIGKMMCDITNSLIIADSYQCEDYQSSFIVSSPKQKRGMIERSDQNQFMDNGIQHKRYLEAKIEKQKNENEELVENIKLLRQDFIRYKEVTVENTQKLLEENEYLKRSLNEAVCQVSTVEAEKMGLSKALSQIEEAFVIQKTSNDENDNIFKKQIERLEKRDRQLRISTIEWFKALEKHHQKISDHYCSAMDYLLSISFKLMSSHNQENQNQKNGLKTDHLITQNVQLHHKNSDYTDMMKIMKEGILLPPCLKKNQDITCRLFSHETDSSTYYEPLTSRESILCQKNEKQNFDPKKSKNSSKLLHSRSLFI